MVFETGAGRSSDDWHVSAWAKTQELRPVRCVVRDHSFGLPGDTLKAERGVLDGVRAGAARHRPRLPGTDGMELYDPGRYAKLHEKEASGGGDHAQSGSGLLDNRDRRVRTRMEAEGCASLRIEGASNCRTFAPDRRFDLRTAGDAAGTYLLTRVEHVIRNGGLGSGDEAEASYSNSFRCHPVELSHRPARVTQRPLIGGSRPQRW